jgi:protein-tyrosine-phosphatase
MTAEYALRAALARRPGIAVASAGTEDRAVLVPSEVSEYLMHKRFDVSAHRRRTLRRQMLDAAHLAIAMSLDHRDFIHVRFGRSVPVFLECCGGPAEELLDLEQAVSDYLSNRAAARAHIQATIDRIIELTPRLADRIDTLLEQSARAPGAVPAARS